MKLLVSLFLASLVSLSALASEPKKATTAKPTEIVITNEAQAQNSQYYSYNFGSIGVNWRISADFVVRNNSSYTLYFNNITISGSSYRAYSGCPYQLYPGQSCVTRVDFQPWYVGYQYGRLGFWFSHGSIIVDLTGYGTRY
jgi:hypothetical protein